MVQTPVRSGDSLPGGDRLRQIRGVADKHVIVVGAGLAGLVLSGCNAALTGSTGASTMTTIATATVTQVHGVPASATGVGPQSSQWAGGPSGESVFSVGTRPVNGIPAIPPGRYGVTLMPGKTDGSWMLCDTPRCGPAYQNNTAATGHSTGPGWQSTMDIDSDARGLWLYNVILTPQ